MRLAQWAGPLLSGGGPVAAVVSGSWAPAGRLSPQLTWENTGATSLAPGEGVGALGLIPRSGWGPQQRGPDCPLSV